MATEHETNLSRILDVASPALPKSGRMEFAELRDGVVRLDWHAASTGLRINATNLSLETIRDFRLFLVDVRKYPRKSPAVCGKCQLSMARVDSWNCSYLPRPTRILAESAVIQSCLVAARSRLTLFTWTRPNYGFRDGLPMRRSNSVFSRSQVFGRRLSAVKSEMRSDSNTCYLNGTTSPFHPGLRIGNKAGIATWSCSGTLRCP